jgi:acetoacetyl-CoA synthetase
MNETFTARRLAGILESPSGLRATYPAGVVEVKAGTTDKPLFCLPGLPGSAFTFRALAAKLHTRRQILAIELHNLGVGPSVLESIEGTAQAIMERMREVQPGGPYAILGYSFGGNLAVDVARQLIANDQTVELVTVVDAYPPGTLRSRSGLSKAATHFRITRELKLREAYTYIRSRIHRRLFGQFQNSLAMDIEPPLPETEIDRRIAEVTKHGIRALDTYRPKIFSGRIVFVYATNLADWMEVTDPSGTYGWGAICEGGVDVIPMTCAHLDFFNEPHVTNFAGHIDSLLNAIDN